MRRDIKERRGTDRGQEPGAVAYEPDRGKGGAAWLWWLLGVLALLVVGLVVFFLLNDGDDAGTTTAGGGGTQGEVDVSGTNTGTIEAGGDSLFPLSDELALSQYSGETVEANSVNVLSVVSDEGFWVGQSEDQRVFVRLAESGESGPNVQPGDRVSFSGTVVENDQNFVESRGITEEEGAQLLERQGHHINVELQNFQIV